MRSKRDGQPIPGTEGTITAAEQAAAIGLKKTEPKPARLPLTPAQAARQARGEWVGDDPVPDYEASVVDDPATIANVLGLRPDDFDAAPLGSMPEGQHFAPPSGRVKIEPRPERASKPAPSRQPLTPEAADELRAAYRAHAAKITKMAEDARGDAAREARAAEQVRASAALGERLKQKLGTL